VKNVKRDFLGGILKGGERSWVCRGGEQSKPQRPEELGGGLKENRHCEKKMLTFRGPWGEKNIEFFKGR